MKRILPVLALVAAMATIMVACNRNPAASVDAIEFAEFQAWKAENEKAAAEAAMVAANPMARKAVSTRSTTYKSPVRVSESQYPAKTTQKKGWSKAAKGAVIGAGTGAVAGAIIHKRNRALGAVIGGVIGGGVGYGVGRHMDKKDGRYFTSNLGSLSSL